MARKFGAHFEHTQYTYTYTHAHTHMHTREQIHTYTIVHINTTWRQGSTSSHTRTHMHTHSQIDTHTHTNQVETMFHEFGHALQHMLTEVEEGHCSGIRGVEWDAVELPSQFMVRGTVEWDGRVGW